MSYIPDMSRNRQQTLMAILRNMASHHNDRRRHGIHLSGYKEDILLRAVEDIGNCRGNLADMVVLRDILMGVVTRERDLLSMTVPAGGDPMQDFHGDPVSDPLERGRINAMEEMMTWLEIRFRLPRGTWRGEGRLWP